jgi:O-succinylhomoserine sulfhydrylase
MRGEADDEYGFETRAVRAGQRRTSEGEHNDPLFLTSSFVFESAAQAYARFTEKEAGNVYSRFTNPTVRTFEERLAALEGGRRCVGTASGMSAILTMCMTVMQSGDHAVVSRNVFGATMTLFSKILARFGIESTFVSPMTQLDAWRDAIRPNTRLLFLESPSNPHIEVADIEALADIAHSRDALLVVDNVMCTPALQRPLGLGADIVVHSATKFLDGQGRCVGGAVVTNEASIGDDLFGFLRTAGPSMSPFNAWVFLKGLETLPVRMHAHSARALALATWLDAHPCVKRVYYPGLASHPQHLLAARQQAAFGGVLSFEVDGGRAAAWRVIDATRLLSITANLGDVKTTITHPATTTHGRLSQAERDAAGIGEGLIRIAVGLEDIEDVKEDLERGLAQARCPASEEAAA